MAEEKRKAWIMKTTKCRSIIGNEFLTFLSTTARWLAILSGQKVIALNLCSQRKNHSLSVQTFLSKSKNTSFWFIWSAFLNNRTLLPVGYSYNLAREDTQVKWLVAFPFSVLLFWFLSPRFTSFPNSSRIQSLKFTLGLSLYFMPNLLFTFRVEVCQFFWNWMGIKNFIIIKH